MVFEAFTVVSVECLGSFFTYFAGVYFVFYMAIWVDATKHSMVAAEYYNLQ